MEFCCGAKYRNFANEIVECMSTSNTLFYMKREDGIWYSVDNFGHASHNAQQLSIKEEYIVSPITSIDSIQCEPTIHNVGVAVTIPNVILDNIIIPEELNPQISTPQTPPDLTKAVKFDAEKPKVTLVPPRALIEVAKAMTYGANKYAADNYLKGGFTHRKLLDSAMCHINSHLQGEDIDESGNTHLSHAAASIMMLIECIITDRIEDDRWKK